MMERVVIVGGGFAGLHAAKGLANARGVDVTLIDQRNHHLFQPLLYQVATAGLSPAEIAARDPRDLVVISFAHGLRTQPAADEGPIHASSPASRFSAKRSRPSWVMCAMSM